MAMITMNAKDYRCICGRRGEFLNIRFEALCERCRDKAIKEMKK